MLLAIFLFSLLLVLNPFFFSYLGGGRGVGVDCGMIGFLLAVEIPLQYKTFKGYFICYSTRCRLDSYLSQFNHSLVVYKVLWFLVLKFYFTLKSFFG